MFSRKFLLSQLLLSYSSISQNCYSLISLCLSWLYGNSISCPFSCTFGTPSQYIVHAPPYFWNRTRGFLEARCSWEPSSSLTTGFLSPFRLLPKVSGAKVHWANANHTFLAHKNPQADTFLRDISPAKLRSTAWVRIPEGISKLVNKVDCCLSYDSFPALCLRHNVGLPCYKILPSGILNVPLPYGMHLKVSPKGRHIFERLSSPKNRKCHGCEALQSGLITQRPFLAVFRVRCVKQSFDGTAFAA